MKISELQQRLSQLPRPQNAAPLYKQMIASLTLFTQSHESTPDIEFSFSQFKEFVSSSNYVQFEDKATAAKTLEDDLKILMMNGPFNDTEVAQASQKLGVFLREWQVAEWKIEDWKNDALEKLDTWLRKEAPAYYPQLKEYKTLDLVKILMQLRASRWNPFSNKTIQLPGTHQKITVPRKECTALITKLLAYRKAKKMIERYAALQAQYPNCSIELVTLKRHEESNILHKGFGLNPDTSLTPVHHSWMARHSENDYPLSKAINASFLDALHQSGTSPSATVKAYVSPVSRALETFAYATLPPERVSQVFINGDLKELKKEGTNRKSRLRRFFSFSADPRGTWRGHGHAMEILKKAGFAINAHTVVTQQMQNTFAKSGTDIDEQDTRAIRAANSIVAPRSVTEAKSNTPSSPLALSVSYNVAHGGILRSMVRRLGSLSPSDADHPIPPGIIPEGNLGYGDSFELFVMRDKDGNTQAVSFNGKYSRFGEDRPVSIMTGKEFEKQTHMSGVKPSPDMVAIEKTLKALSAFARADAKGETIKPGFTAGLFKKSKPPISNWDAYNKTVKELQGKVQTQLENAVPNSKAEQGLAHLDTQLTSYLKRVEREKTAAPPATPQEQSRMTAENSS